MFHRRQNKQRGFVVTVELLLIFTIVVIAILVALAGLRRVLVLSGVDVQPTLVGDSTAPTSILVGIVFALDDSETPHIRRLDPNNGLTYVLGVRRDRFVTRAPVFYDGVGCTGTAYVADPAFQGPTPASAADDPALTGALQRLQGRVGHFNRMRADAADAGDSRPVIYAVGFSPATVSAVSPYGTGLLYRHRSGSTTSAVTTASVFVSSWDHTEAETGDSDPLNPCRSLIDTFTGLLPADEVLNSTTSMNVLLPYTAPFVVR